MGVGGEAVRLESVLGLQHQRLPRRGQHSGGRLLLVEVGQGEVGL